MDSYTLEVSQDDIPRGIAFQGRGHPMLRGNDQSKAGILGLTKAPTYGILYTSWQTFLDKRRSPAHAQTQRRINTRYTSVFNNAPWDQITKAAVTEYIDSLDVSNCTANTIIGQLTYCFNYHVELGAIDYNPLAKMRRFGHEPAKPYVPPEEDLNKLLAHMSHEWPERVLLADFALETGCRIGEAVDTKFRPSDKWLGWADCRLQEDQPLVRLWTAKSGKSTWIEADMPISRDLARRLMEWKSRGEGDGEHVFPWAYSSLKRWIKRCCIEVKIKPFGWHSLRHFFAHYLASQDISTRDIQLGLRHKSIQITERYLQGIQPSHDLVKHTFKREVCRAAIQA